MKQQMKKPNENLERILLKPLKKSMILSRHNVVVYYQKSMSYGEVRKPIELVAQKLH